MTTITFVEASGREVVAEADGEYTLMELAVAHDVEGVLAECGGACVCATCHCYIDGGASDSIDEPSEFEMMLLDDAPHRTDASRLACQIPLNSDLDGLVVKVPPAE
ncbi:MAG: 2Fe-2S iron-sulfur cluster-binding protein [Pseudomonadota bacterium]